MHGIEEQVESQHVRDDYYHHEQPDLTKPSIRLIQVLPLLS